MTFVYEVLSYTGLKSAPSTLYKNAIDMAVFVRLHLNIVLNGICDFPAKYTLICNVSIYETVCSIPCFPYLTVNSITVGMVLAAHFSFIFYL